MQPNEVIFVTSRSLTVEQQSNYTGVEKFDPQNLKLVQSWNGDLHEIVQAGINIMTYDKIINILTTKNSYDNETLQNVKIIIFDECHTLFCDNFIHNIASLQVWINKVLETGSKIILGMTATPNILYYNEKKWGVHINEITTVPCIGHKAKKMICTEDETIPYLIASNTLEGKNLVLCDSIAKCYRLKSQIPNSTVLVSQNAKEHTKEMFRIRQYIAKHEMFPETYSDDSGTHKLNTLLVTSTAREGFNLCEKSGVRNIISCYSDSMNITQIIGRARYDLDTIVVAPPKHIWSDNLSQNVYFRQEHLLYKEFMSNKQSLKWFDCVAHLVNTDVKDVFRFRLSSDEARFINYINSKWLVPEGVEGVATMPYRIYKDEDKQEIIQVYTDCRIDDPKTTKITFARIMKMLKNCLGYTVYNARMQTEHARATYKLITSYDEENVCYVKAIDPFENA